jgi:hypothetical protein
MARIRQGADPRCSWRRGRRLRDPSSVAMGTDVVLFADWRRLVQMARLLAAHTERNEWSLCGRTDGSAGFDEPLCPGYRSVDSDLEIVVVDRSPSDEWRVACHADFLGFLSATGDVWLPCVVHDTRQSSHVQQGMRSSVRHASSRTLVFLRQMGQGGTGPRADSLASPADIGETPRLAKDTTTTGRSVAFLTVQAMPIGRPSARVSPRRDRRRRSTNSAPR